jgi:hypothetical protein
MRYYLRNNDNDDATDNGPYRIADIQAALAEGLISSNTMARRECEQVWYPLGELLCSELANIAVPTVGQSSLQTHERRAQTTRATRGAHLRYIRRNTHYGLLRNLVCIFSWMCVICFGYVGGRVVVEACQRPDLANFFQSCLSGFFIFGIPTAILFLVKRFITMLIDQADSTLLANSKLGSS